MLLPAEPYNSFANYREAAGGSAVERALGLGPDAILDAIARSGLRGRGGAGFPSGIKWRTLRNHPCETRYVVCNAAEGEPGTFKDRFLIRANPYAILEGIAIGVIAIAAKEAFIGVRASCKREIKRLKGAITEMEVAGALGNVKISIFEGPEEYLFGEEKALLNAIENGTPLPREAHYPPYELGLWATALSPNPALVNNAETFAHVATIVRSGADAFRARGTHDTPGTLLCTVSGDVKRPGVYEVDAGLSLRSLIERAGGIVGKAKCVVAGTAAGIVGADKLDTPLEFGALALAGSGLGSAGFIVYNDTRSAPRIAQSLLRFLYVESCNQCSPCKHGLRMASNALDAMFDAGSVAGDDVERALFGVRSAPQANRCYLPQQAANLLPSLVAKFRGEFDQQIAHPLAPSARIPIPLFADYDEAKHEFTYESSIERKQPDWSYAEPLVAGDANANGNKKRKHAPPTAPIGVRLEVDVLERLVHQAEEENEHVDRLVNRWLRERLSETKHNKNDEPRETSAGDEP